MVSQIPGIILGQREWKMHPFGRSEVDGRGPVSLVRSAGAPFLELPPAFRQLQDHMLRKPGGDREMVDILALVIHHDEQAVLTAVELALAEGVLIKTHVLNLLHRLVDGKVIGGPPLDTPRAPVLRQCNDRHW